MKSYMRLGLRNLARRRSRSFLTAAGVILAVGFTVGLLSISEGFMRSFNNVLTAQGPDLFVMARGESKMPFPLRGTSTIDENMWRIVAGIPGVRQAEPVYSTFCVSSGAGIMGAMGGMPTIVAGIPTKGFFRMRPGATVEKGRWLRESDGGSIVLGGVVAENLGKGLGDDVELISGAHLKVIGILRKDNAPYDFFSYTPLKPLQKIFGIKGRISYVLVKSERPDDMDALVKRLKKAFPNYDVQSVSELADQAQQMMSMARAIHFGVSCFALIIGVLFVACTMIMSVAERIREFAALRVIGAPRGYVMKLIMSESVALSFSGGLLGCLFGVLLSKLIDFMIFKFVGETFLHTYVSARIFGIGLGIALLIGVVAAILPALMILRRNLAESLRYE